MDYSVWRGFLFSFGVNLECAEMLGVHVQLLPSLLWSGPALGLWARSDNTFLSAAVSVQIHCRWYHERMSRPWTHTHTHTHTGWCHSQPRSRCTIRRSVCKNSCHGQIRQRTAFINSEPCCTSESYSVAFGSIQNVSSEIMLLPKRISGFN